MENNRETIDLAKILRLCWRKKKLFLIVWVATFVGSCIIILPQPRGYSASVTLAPEHSAGELGGSIGSIASTFGVNIGSTMTNDAFYPLIYPDLVASNDFMVSLFDIPVHSLDGQINCSLYEYMDKHQEVAYYELPFLAMGRWFRSTFGEKDPVLSADNNATETRPSFMLDRRQTMIVKKLRKLIDCRVDKKTEVITLKTKAQDKLIAAQLADSVTTRLQAFITDYRTNKARLDVEYYTKLTAEAKAAYEAQRRAYTGFADSHMGISLPSYQARLEDLENEMQLRYNTYTTMVSQLELAEAKVQERTPAFTIIEAATVPVKASSPKRMLFCAAMLFLATLITGFILLKREG